MKCQFVLLTNGRLLGRAEAVKQVAELHQAAAKLVQEAVTFAIPAEKTDHDQRQANRLEDEAFNPFEQFDPFDSDCDGFHDKSFDCSLN
jgi:hypothetical protein